MYTWDEIFYIFHRESHDNARCENINQMEKVRTSVEAKMIFVSYLFTGSDAFFRAEKFRPDL